jgi:hypothetical protein
MMSKHTPGPWHYGLMSQTVFSHGRDGRSYTAVCELGFRDEDECKPDAAVIAAAPDMLDELYRLLPFMEDAEKDSAYKPGVVRERVNAIRALIARAEG